MKPTLLLVLCAPLLTSALSSTSKAASAMATPSVEKPAGVALPPTDFVLKDPVAEVEGQPINKVDLEGTLNAALAQHGKTLADFSREQKLQGYHAVLDQIVMQKLIAKRSADVAVTDAEVDAEYNRLKQRYGSEEQMKAEVARTGQTLDQIKDSLRKNIRARKWIDAQIGGKVDVSEADAQSFYDKNPEKFNMPETVRASHILIAVPKDASPEVAAKKQKDAEAALARVKGGESFAKVASELSDDPGSKIKGGDLDFFPRERMVPEFADAAFKLKKDEVSGLVKTQFGYHIIKATDRKDARVVPFPEVKEKLMAFMSNQKRQNAVQTLLADIRQKADVKIYLPPAQAAEVR